jgi:hypothetical protein
VAEAHTYRAHLAGNLQAPVGCPDTIRLDEDDLLTRKALGKALREQHALPPRTSVRTAMTIGHDLHITTGRDRGLNLTRTDVWTIIGRGKAGWWAERPGCSGSGGTLETINGTRFDGRPFSSAGYLADAAEGCHVFDADATDYSAYVNHVMSGPILSASLADNEVQTFGPDLQAAAARMMPGLSGGFEVLAADGIASTQSTRRTYSSLDRVGWGIFRGLLEALGGVRFGTVRGGKVVWEASNPE